MFITQEDLLARLQRTNGNKETVASKLPEEEYIADEQSEDSMFAPAPAEKSETDNSEFSAASASNQQSAIDSLLDGIDSPDVLEVQEKRFRGKTPGAKNIPDFLRPLIGASCLLSGVRETQEAFGLASTATPVHASKGKTSQYSPIDEEQKAQVNKIVGEAEDAIKDAAVEKLMSALGHLTDDKMSKSKGVEVSTIAKNMASIVNKITPKEKDVINPTQIIIYAPAQKDLSHYDTIPSV